MNKWFAVSTLAMSVALAGCLSNSSSRSSNDNQPEPTPTPQNISLSKLGSYSSGQYGVSAAEIPAFDPVNKRIFIVNAQSGKVDVLNAEDPQNLTRIEELATQVPNATINSISYHDGLLAVAVESSPKTTNGFVELYDATTLALIDSAGVGALPDMVTFTPDGKYVLVANEGEPNDDYSIDPEGSVSVVEVLADKTGFGTNRTAGFDAFNAQKDDLIARGVRIYGPADNTQPYSPANTTSVARDMEPEYIAVSEDSAIAWVALQENNAFARLDIASATITDIQPLGYKDYGLEGNAIDASDEDSTDGKGDAHLNFQQWPGVVGMYHPDAISSYSVDGKTYIVSANEGDARAWGEDNDAYWAGDRSKGFVEEFRVKHLVHHNADGFERRAGDDMPQQLRDLAKGAMLDPAVFDYCGAGETAGRSGGCREDFAAADGSNASGLGRLNISWVQGYHTNADGSPRYYTRDGIEDASLTAADGYLMYHTLYSYGARSFSIWDEDGQQVWDSGDFFEKFLADRSDFECKLGAERKIACLDYFNSGHDEGDAFDSRSDAKGPEPEGIAVGKIGEQTFAFIGLERMGGVMVFDITDPQAPLFQDYLNARENWDDEPEDLFDEGRLDEAGDLGPEGLVFVSAEDSPTEQPLLIVGNEVSGTTTVFQIELADRTE